MNDQGKPAVMAALFYCLFLMAGIAVIYFGQCRVYMYLNSLAQTACTDLAEHGTITDIEPYMDTSILFYTEDGIEELHINRSQEQYPFRKWVDMHSHFYESQSSAYTVPSFFSPLSFVAISAAPVYRDDRFLGEVYVMYAIAYLPTFVLTFILVYSILYLLIIYGIWFVWKTNAEITHIYHQYISNVSHELKSPIASIQAITETLSEGLVHDEATLSRYYGIISREARQLEHSVLQIIELSKMQDHRMDFDKEEVEPSEIFDPVCHTYASRCEDIGIAFEINESIRSLPPLYTNANRIRQLLDILLDNAIKFVDDEDGRITLSATRKFSQVTIRVDDNGCGISQEALPHIFERFYKSNASNNVTGSGLGLAIAHEIAVGLDEKLWARSELGHGSVFFFTVSVA